VEIRLVEVNCRYFLELYPNLEPIQLDIDFTELTSSPASYSDVELTQTEDPFGALRLATILALSKYQSNVLALSESNYLEYKGSFHLNSSPEYAKTMAAFANTRGGYIVFGIQDISREIIGLKGDSFDRLDPEKLTNRLNDLFSPVITFRLHTTTIANLKVGLLYTYPNIVKPVIAKVNSGSDVKEGEIYYRYEARSEKIKYPELRTIIEDQRRRETEVWLKYMSLIAKGGVDNVVIVDSASGEASTASNRTYFLDESLLAQVRIAAEGRTHLTEGAPSLKLIGSLQEVPTGLVRKVIQQVQIPVDKPIAIRTDDIVRAFLNQETVANPTLYIEQVCFSESAFMPIYYFAHLAGMKIPSLKQAVQEIRTASPRVKNKLIERLEKSAERFASGISNVDSTLASAKLRIKEAILCRQLNSHIHKSDIIQTLMAVRTLNREEIQIEYLFPLLHDLYQLY
jgi:hypothetical protein